MLLRLKHRIGFMTRKATPFGLVFLAEIGDKSQPVCKTLAARHRYWLMLAGLMTAFLVLNTLAVVFGAGLSHWVPLRFSSLFSASSP